MSERGAVHLVDDAAFDAAGAKTLTREPRIGPNAITRMAEALVEQHGDALMYLAFVQAGLEHHIREMPKRMVDEGDVIRLHAAVRSMLGPDGARVASRRAGILTADYLLARRIPRPAQWLLKLLPTALAAPPLLAAIRRHSWTFAGSGRFTAVSGRTLRMEIACCPICRGARADDPICDYYAATFEHLFRALIHPRIAVRETQCQAQGAAACVFEASLPVATGSSRTTG